ncbi:acyl-CoA/acyl-ACP dehydrogenase [Pseudomaricurvus alkylphenolicus]|nr:acyl-CoA dehydrogenase family protein [Pseudomaricurvus alkylphenolicus]NIB38054.1 acyl-CoA/acyl-ACP dehydrogenase [Pseudomaricurvus alkylphenolicus]
MNFEEQEHITMLRQSIRRFLDQNYSREQAREQDRTMAFAREAFQKLCDLGVTGLTVPEEYGGAGVDVVAAMATIEELCKRGTGLAGPFIHCAFYGGMNLVENGSEAQKREFLPRLATGELLFAYGLSEPDVGGDLPSVKATATLKEDGKTLVLNGTKRWCTAARIADYILTLVRTGPVEEKYKNLSMVMVPASAPGITIVDIEHTGIHYAETTDVIMEDVEVSIDNVLGGPDCLNKGWPMLVGRGLDVERLETAAIGVGIATAAVEDAWQYAQERSQFGKKICGHQAVRHSLSDVKTKLQACRHMLYHAAWLADAGKDLAVESSMAKLFVGDTSVEIVLECQRIMGAYGYANEYDMERYVRDILSLPIAGGSSNMQKNNIANRLGLPQR